MIGRARSGLGGTPQGLALTEGLGIALRRLAPAGLITGKRQRLLEDTDSFARLGSQLLRCLAELRGHVRSGTGAKKCSRRLCLGSPDRHLQWGFAHVLDNVHVHAVADELTGGVLVPAQRKTWSAVSPEESVVSMSIRLGRSSTGNRNDDASWSSCSGVRESLVLLMCQWARCSGCEA